MTAKTLSLKGSYKRALVTGGAGFIGSHIIEDLLKDGLEVISIDGYSAGKSINLKHCKEYRGFTEVNYDIIDPSGLDRFFEGVDIVSHNSDSAGVPAYNEELLIGKTLKNMPDYVGKILVVNDGSKDRTKELILIWMDIEENRKLWPITSASDYSAIKKSIAEGPMIRKNHQFKIAAGLAFIIIHADNAYAYLDPGTGSMILQAIVAGTLGAGFVIKTYWRRIIDFFNSKKNREK